MALPPRRLALFAALSAADLLLTWHLLTNTGGAVYESNPVAQGFLDRFGWAGLAAFKAAVVAVCLGACVVVSRHRPRVARSVLTFGCAVLAVVVLYSGGVAAWVPAGEAGEHAELVDHAAELDAAIGTEREYQALLHSLGEDLVARQAGLSEAVAVLAATDKGRNALWLAKLRRLHGFRSVEECLAANLIHHTVLSRSEDRPRARRLAVRLADEFTACYGTPAPRYDEMLSMTGQKSGGRRPARPAALSPVW
jgi:hypothetical protein